MSAVGLGYLSLVLHFQLPLDSRFCHISTNSTCCGRRMRLLQYIGPYPTYFWEPWVLWQRCVQGCASGQHPPALTEGQGFGKESGTRVKSTGLRSRLPPAAPGLRHALMVGQALTPHPTPNSAPNLRSCIEVDSNELASLCDAAQTCSALTPPQHQKLRNGPLK